MIASAIPTWQPRPEVWVLVVALIALGVYAHRVIQPKAVAAGGDPISGRQKAWFWLGVLVFWLAADFPMHDIAEQRLYSVHMFQHSLLMVVFPPVMLLATPTWLARLIIGQGGFKRFVYWAARPAPALIFNLALTAFTHWEWAVNISITNGFIHYGLHILMVASSLFVWMTVCGPIPELRVGPPMKMLVIFLLSIIPTIPAAFLTTADGVLYSGYDHGPRLWGLTVEADQQLAGVFMKVVTGFYLWMIIAAIFFKWAFGDRGQKAKYRGKFVPSANYVDPALAEAGAEQATGDPTGPGQPPTAREPAGG